MWHQEGSAMGGKSKKVSPASYLTKKCPFCFTYLPLSASKCKACHKRVGDVDKLGFAGKPTDWTGYFIAVAAIVGFCIFIWYGFFKP